MNEENTNAKAKAPEPGRCRAGSKTASPCWREAATTYRDYPCCQEHARLYEIGEEEDGWYHALDALEEFVRGPVSEDPYGELERLALNMRDEARREYADARARAEAARMVAEHGPPEPGEPALTLEQAQELTRLIVRADSFVNARTVLEDAPEDVLGLFDRWVIVNALAGAADEANEEASRYREKLGLKDVPPEEVQPESGRENRSCA